MFSFRQRFEIAPWGRLPFAGQTFVVSDADGVTVELRSLEEKSLAESTKMSIWGVGYESTVAASAGGERWRRAVQSALAGVGLGANFGLRNPDVGGFVDSVLEKMSSETGTPVYRDSWDVLAFPCEPQPRFSSLTAEGYMTPHEAVVRAAFKASSDRDEVSNEVAFDLYSAAMRSAHMADVRVVLLVMAIECLIVRRERPPSSQEHIRNLVKITLDNNDLDQEDRETLANALRSLRHQSTTKAATEIAKRLEATSYADDPVSLIRESFKMRHALVHGHDRPDLERVRYVGANLERMVGDLVAGSTVTAAVAAARASLEVAK